MNNRHFHFQSSLAAILLALCAPGCNGSSKIQMTVHDTPPQRSVDAPLGPTEWARSEWSLEQLRTVARTAKDIGQAIRDTPKLAILDVSASSYADRENVNIAKCRTKYERFTECNIGQRFVIHRTSNGAGEVVYLESLLPEVRDELCEAFARCVREAWSDRRVPYPAGQGELFAVSAGVYRTYPGIVSDRQYRKHYDTVIRSAEDALHEESLTRLDLLSQTHAIANYHAKVKDAQTVLAYLDGEYKSPPEDGEEDAQRTE